MHTTAAKVVAAGFFPLDRRWRLRRDSYSPGLTKDIVWLSGLLPFEQAAEVLERVGCQMIPRSSIWDRSEQHGERFRSHLKREQEQTRPERVVLPPPGQDHQEPKGISMDGGMVNIRGEGWKEIKVGAVFDVERREEWDPITSESVPQARAKDIDYAAVLGSAEEFGPALWALAVKRDVPRAARSSVTADGSEWICLSWPGEPGN